jgi:hypothetical protein
MTEIPTSPTVACRVPLMAIIHCHRPVRALTCALYRDKNTFDRNTAAPWPGDLDLPPLPGLPRAKASRRASIRGHVCKGPFVNTLSICKGSCRRTARNWHRRPSDRTEDAVGPVVLRRCHRKGWGPHFARFASGRVTASVCTTLRCRPVRAGCGGRTLVIGVRGQFELRSRAFLLR